MFNNIYNKKEQQEQLYFLIKKQIELRPLIQISDIYKLIYQSILGPGHAIGDIKKFEYNLTSELATINENEFPDEELLENISLIDNVFRVNLRPFKRRKNDHFSLITAVVKSAKYWSGTKDHLIFYWELFRDMSLKDFFWFEDKDIQKFNEFIINNIRNNTYPYTHHSKIYSENYKPSYRIISGKFINSI
ncbi:MAG: hypothetical protein QXG00_03750 [Candidatus Woesearchaeota archaeon]